MCMTVPAPILSQSRLALKQQVTLNHFHRAKIAASAHGRAGRPGASAYKTRASLPPAKLFWSPCLTLAASHQPPIFPPRRSTKTSLFNCALTNIATRAHRVLILHIYALSKARGNFAIGTSLIRLRQPNEQPHPVASSDPPRQRLAGFAFGLSTTSRTNSLSRPTVTSDPRHSCQRLRGTHLLVALLRPVRSPSAPRTDPHPHPASTDLALYSRSRSLLALTVAAVQEHTLTCAVCQDP